MSTAKVYCSNRQNRFIRSISTSIQLNAVFTSLRSMKSIDRTSVPCYLQKGDFFLCLADGEDNTISVPDNVLKSDTNIGSDADLVHLLSSMRFWLIQDLPKEVFDYFLKDDVSQDITSDLLRICQDFEVQFPLLHLLYEIRNTLVPDRVRTAIVLKSLPILKHLHASMGHKLLQQSCATAALAGACDCLRYVHENGCEIGADCCEMAAMHGSLDCLIYLHSVNAPWDTRVCRVACAEGHLDCLLFATEHGCPPYEGSANYAASGGHLDCLKYVIERGEGATKLVAISAAAQGHVHILEYLHSIGCEWGVAVTARAAETGQFDCLRFLHENGCPWDHTTCHNAAYKGHLHCLQYAHQHGCALHTSTTLCAVGHVECMRYLHEQGCPWHEGVCLAAVHKNHLQSALYAVLHHAPHTFEFYAYVESAEWSEVLDALHAQGYPERYDQEEENGNDSVDAISDVFTF